MGVPVALAVVEEAELVVFGLDAALLLAQAAITSAMLEPASTATIILYAAFICAYPPGT
jgi:hypothetical protein